jgi:SNF2 family DNA or RNA helicase
MVHTIKGLKPYTLPSFPIYIVHYGLLAAWKDTLLALDPKIIVFDEIQALRHPTTAKYSAASAIAEGAKYVWGTSGTPIYGLGAEIWSVLNILDYHCLGDRDSFTREWCVGYRQDRVENPEVLGNWLRREGLMIRRTLEDADVKIHLPPKRRIVHAIDSDKDKYAHLVEEAVRLAHGYESIKDWHEKGLAKRRIEADARKATGVAKAPYVASFVRSLLDAGERVLLCAHHHDVHEILAEKLKDFHPVRISGLETTAQKDEALGKFAKGKTNLIQLALRSSAGLDGLQGRGSCVVFAELDWSPAIHSQIESRLHRIGVDESLESILAYYLVTDTGIDETIQEFLGIKVGQFVGIMGDKKPTADAELLNQRAAEKHMDSVIKRLKDQFKPKPKEATAT